jgi:hypothetical protein
VRVGSPAVHPCRGVGRAEPISPEESSSLSALVSESIESLRGVVEASRRLWDALGLAPRADATFKEIQRLALLALRVVKAPRVDRAQIGNPVWDSKREQVADLVTRVQAFAASRAEVEDKVADVAWRTDLSATRRHLAGHGRSLFR